MAVAGAIPGFALGLAGYIARWSAAACLGYQCDNSPFYRRSDLLFVVAALVFAFLDTKLDKNLLQQVEDALSERRAAKLAQPK